MRHFLIATLVAIGAAVTAPAMAAPSLAGANALTTAATSTEAAGVEQVQYRVREERRRYGRSYGPRGYAYGRRYSGPPPHARAYGRRGYDRGYGRRF